MSAKISIKNIGEVPAFVQQADGSVHEVQPLGRIVLDFAKGGAVTEVRPEVSPAKAKKK